MGVLDEPKLRLLQQAAQDVIDGKLDAQFVVDIFQTGSGTSTNMNTNEVIASRANEIATGKRGGKSPVHPNDHVNQQQSSNDVIPTAMHVAAAVAMREELIPALAHLEQGSVTVRVGDIVHQGQPLAAVGNNGHSNQPHLHLQVQDSPAGADAERTYPMLFRNVHITRGGAWPGSDSRGVRTGDLVRALAQ